MSPDRAEGKEGGKMIDEDIFQDVISTKRGVNLQTLKQVITLAIEIAREGREGRKIGTMFVVSDSEAVLNRSACNDPRPAHVSSR